MKTVLNIIFIFWTATILSSHAVAENYNDRFIAEDAAVIAFTNARVIDGTGGKTKEKHTVIIRDGRITKIGRDGKVKIPKGAKRISLKGKSLLPGWVMMHEHLNSEDLVLDIAPVPFFTPHPISYPRLLLAAGVTSARTAGTVSPFTDLRVKESIDNGWAVGPSYDLTAPYISLRAMAPGGPAINLGLPPALITPEAVKEGVRFWAAQGFTSVKTLMVTRAQMQAAVEEAHRLGLKVIAHLCNVTHREAIDLGVDQIEHGFVTLGTSFEANRTPDECSWVNSLDITENLNPESEKVQALFRQLIKNNVVITSTLEALARASFKTALVEEVPSEILEYLTPEGRRIYGQKSLLQSKREDSTAYLKSLMALEAAFWRAGGTLVVGSDAGLVGVMPGYANLKSIEFLVRSGIPALDVLKIATSNGAQAMGVADDRGTIEVGKRADLIVIKGDPSVDISDIHEIETVFKNGVGYNPSSLKESVKGTIGGPW